MLVEGINAACQFGHPKPIHTLAGKIFVMLWPAEMITAAPKLTAEERGLLFSPSFFLFWLVYLSKTARDVSSQRVPLPLQGMQYPL